MPSEVEAGGCEVLAQGVGRLEVDALQHALLQCGGHGLSGHGVAREMVEHLRNLGERLVELRRHLHEVAWHGRSRQRVVLAVGEYAMQGVSKLMEHGAHLVPCEERRLSLGRLGVVAHVIDDGQLVALSALLGEAAHPCAAPLCGPAEEVAVEQGDGLSVAVEHFKHLHVGMIGGDVLALLECQAVGAVGGVEHAIDLHTVDIEVRLHLIVGDVEHFLLHLCRVVEAVVGLQAEILALGALRVLLNGARLGVGLGRILADELCEEIVHVLHILRRGALQCEVGVGVVAHDLRLLGAQFRYLHHDGERVVFRVGAIGAMNAGLIHPASQVAVGQVGENGLLRGVDDHDAVGRLGPTALRVVLTLRNVGFAQSGQFLLAFYPHHGVVGGVGQQVAPLLLQVGDARVDLLHALHLIGGQQCSRAHESLVDDLRESFVLALEFRILVVVHIFHTLEELLVERNLVAQVGHHGRHLLLRLGDDGRLVGAGQTEEHARHAVEHHATLLIGEDGVGEGGFLLVVHDLLDVGALYLDGLLDGRQVVGLLNLVEVGRSKGQATLLQQRVLPTR